MSFVAIVGAGPIGAAVAQRLAERQRVRTAIRLIDATSSVAIGKALDIQQAGPVEGVDIRLTGSGDPLAATGAAVIVIADDVAAGQWADDDRGVALIRELLRAGTTSPFVFAGPHQHSLMERCYRDLKVPAARLLGTGASAMVGVAQALAGLELNASGAQVAVVGRPPDLVVAWSSATIGGAMLTDRIAAHRLAAIARSLPKFWPPGPYAIASATAPVVEALIMGSRAWLPASTILDGDLGARGAAVLLPLELGRLRVLGHGVPSLSAQERTGLVNSIGLSV